MNIWVECGVNTYFSQSALGPEGYARDSPNGSIKCVREVQVAFQCAKVLNGDGESRSTTGQ